MDLSLQHLLCYEDEGEDMLTSNRIVTEDESWVYHYQPGSKRASMQWKRPIPTSAKKVEVKPSGGKVMLSVFLESQRVLITRFQKREENMYSLSYCEVLLKLHGRLRL
jgi:hypothetical protein